MNSLQELLLTSKIRELMESAEAELKQALKTEEESGEAMDSMERTYCEGVVDTLDRVLTYLNELKA